VTEESLHSTANGLTRIVVADDHPLYREALRSMLGGQPDLEVVAEAADGAQALELCRQFRPDLVLMDMRMPQVDGLAATRAIKSAFPRTIVLVLTALEEPNHLSEALKAGAGGYILKYANPQEVIDAVRKVLTGEASLDQEVATRLLLRLMDEAPKNKDPESLPEVRFASDKYPAPIHSGSLSPREVEVLRLIARGQSNQEIARNLLISASTVKKHVRHIISKLGVSDRVQAAVRAIELGHFSEREG